jgi:hypothetical protein
VGPTDQPPRSNRPKWFGRTEPNIHPPSITLSLTTTWRPSRRHRRRLALAVSGHRRRIVATRRLPPLLYLSTEGFGLGCSAALTRTPSDPLGLGFWWTRRLRRAWPLSSARLAGLASPKWPRVTGLGFIEVFFLDVLGHGFCYLCFPSNGARLHEQVTFSSHSFLLYQCYRWPLDSPLPFPQFGELGFRCTEAFLQFMHALMLWYALASVI